MSDSKIKAEVRAIADKIKTIHKTPTEGHIEDDTSFEACMDDTVTMDAVKAVDTYKTNFVAGSALATSEIFVAAMAKDKKLESGTATFKTNGRSSIDHTVTRTQTFPNSFAKEGEPSTITKHGVIRTSINDVAGRNSGQLKIVRDEIGEIAAKKLK